MWEEQLECGYEKEEGGVHEYSDYCYIEWVYQERKVHA